MWSPHWLFLVVVPFCLVPHFLSPPHPSAPTTSQNLAQGTDINNLVCFSPYFFHTYGVLYRHTYMYINTHVRKWGGCLSLFYMAASYSRCFKGKILCFSHLTKIWHPVEFHPHHWYNLNLKFYVNVHCFQYKRTVIYSAIPWHMGSI